MKNKSFLLFLVILFLATFGATVGVLDVAQKVTTKPLQTQTVALDPIASTITANGTVHSQSEATLHFQTAGKLVSLPYQEGDTVKQGATIARLDTYSLQKTLEVAANAYETAKNNNDQVQENQTTGDLEGTQRTAFDTYNKNSYSSSPVTEAQAITDAVKRLVDNSDLAQNSAQLNVDLANYALQLATLTSPISGVITNEDVTVPGQNITTATTFSVADPSALVFRADVLATDIDFVSVGAAVTIQIDGQNQTYHGTVSKIYPDKTILSNGQEVYRVDIVSSELTAKAKLSQAGNVIIQSNTNPNVIMVPTWTVLNHNNIWVIEQNKPVLKQVTTGAVHGDKIEVTGGLSPNDKIMVNPEDIAKMKYQLL